MQDPLKQASVAEEHEGITVQPNLNTTTTASPNGEHGVLSSQPPPHGDLQSAVGQPETQRPFRSLFTVRRCLVDARVNYAKLFLVADKTLRLEKGDITRRVNEMTHQANQPNFNPPYDYLLEMRILHFLTLDSKLIKPAIKMTLDSLRKYSGPRTAQPWMAAWTSLGREDDTILRAFLATVTRELFIAYQTRITVETVKANLTWMISAAYVTLTAACLLGFWLSNHMLVFLLCVCGLTGAWLSIFQRISKLDKVGLDIRQLTAFMNAPHGLLVSLLFGMLAPILAVLFITSGVLHSSFLPKVDSLSVIKQTYSQFQTDFSSNAAIELSRYVATLPPLPPGTGENNPGQARDQKSQNAFIASVDGTSAEVFDHLANLKFERTFTRLLLLAFVCGFGERFINDAIATLLKRFGKQTTDQSPQTEETN